MIPTIYINFTRPAMAGGGWGRLNLILCQIFDPMMFHSLFNDPIQNLSINILLLRV